MLDSLSTSKEKDKPIPSVVTLEKSAAFLDTVGQFAWYEGLRRMRVRGYGIVAGLGTNGSNECPPAIREQLIQSMYKNPAFAGQGSGGHYLTPMELLDDLDTAVVAVQGEISPAAVKGDRFDVSIEALPGTQTRSLEGGRLYTCELTIVSAMDEGGAVSGRALAEAAGPIFLNPFASNEDAATKVNLRRGYVIGGGVNLEDRRVHLVLGVASYPRSRAIMAQINERFPGEPKVADAVSPGKVQLRIPPAYRDDPTHFLAVVRHLYLSDDATFLEQRLLALAAEMDKEKAPWPEISLAFEGLGRTAWATLQPLYRSPRPEIRYFAAVAGLRTGDPLAVEVMRRETQDADSGFRLASITALGRAGDNVLGSGPLKALLNDEDPRIRVAAYEALLERKDTCIESTPIAGDNLILDRIPTTGLNLIYARRNGEPRLALFGKNLTCAPPAFYRHRDDTVTINAYPGEPNLTVLRRSPVSHNVSPPISVASDVASLVTMLGEDAELGEDGQVRGLGLNYSTIVAALNEFCAQGAINAKFMLEQPSVAALFGPQKPSGRSESEL